MQEETKLPTSDLASFLDAKPLFYDEIDYERMPRTYKRIQHHFTIPNIIHIVGTNGKGTTGRFLAAALKNAGKRVGHYTSPHILRFNERIWIDGSDVSDAVLQRAHEKLQDILSEEESVALSYFEYTTLLAMLCFEECEYVVLEAGLGGEYDATAVFAKMLTIATPIDKDHEAFLGGTIEEITKTKLGAMAKKLLLAKQQHNEVYAIAVKMAQQKDAELYKVEEMLEESDKELARLLGQKLALPKYLQENLQSAIVTMKILHLPYSAKSFEDARLFGRLTPLRQNVLLDVGHNPLAARSIAEALDGQKVVLVYNSFKDKDYRSILSLLSPVIKRVEILEVPGQRVEAKELLQKTLNDLKIQYGDFHRIEQDEKYLVFGSFSVAEEFLKRMDA